MPSNRYQFEPLERRQMLSIIPAVVSAQFEYLTAQRLVIQFNTDVSASLTNADLQLQNHTTMSRTAPASISLLSYDGATNTAVFAIPGAPAGILSDGDYRLRVLKAGVTDSMGSPMAQDGVLDFFVFAGDANRDRTIDIGDFGLLAANFNAPSNFAGGDFDYSGVTDISDFATLASKFNRSLPALASPAVRYSVTVLPASGGAFGVNFLPMAINDNGQVVGRRFIFDGGPQTGDANGFSWRPGESTLTHNQATTAADVANDGTIVGWSTFGGWAGRFTQGGPIQLLDDIPGSAPGQERALGTNNFGQIVGNDDRPNPASPQQPIGVWWPSGPSSVQPIGAQMLTGIDDSGHMIGNGPRLFPPGGGSATNIGASDGLPLSVNESREVVGVIGSYSIAEDIRPRLYDTSGNSFYWKPGMADPFLLESFGVTDVQPRAINNAGVIVGSGGSASVGGGALIWNSGMPYNLKNLADPIPGMNYQLEGAVDINESGQILAYGRLLPDPISSVNTRAFVLTPILSSGAAAKKFIDTANEAAQTPFGSFSPVIIDRSLARQELGDVRVDVLRIALEP